MKWLRRVALGVLVLSSGLPGTECAAQDRNRSAQQAYEEADLIQAEYHQDLEQAKQEASRLIKRASGADNGWAELYGARVARLRGDYREAVRLADAAGASATLQVQAYALIEKRWTVFEQMQAPWGAFNPIAPDRVCQQPWVPLGGQQFLSEVTLLMRKLEKQEKGRAAGPLWLTALEQRAENVGSAIDIATALRSTPMSAEIDPKKVMPQVRDILKSLSQSQQDALPMAGHILRLSQRLMPQLFARLDMKEDLQKAVPCANGPDAVDPERALICAELRLFPGGVPEDLGHSVRAVLTMPSSRFQNPDRSAYVDSIATWRRGPVADGAQWLQAADRGFLAQHNRRGLARVQFVRGADLLAAEIAREAAPDEPAKAATAVRGVIEALSSARDLGRATGDGVLVRRSQALLAIAYALQLNRTQAETVINELLAGTDGSPAESAALGELYDAVGRALNETRHDSSAYERLAAISERLYASSPIEASFALQQRAELLELSGMTWQAIEVYQEAWRKIHPQRCDKEDLSHCQDVPYRCSWPGILPGAYYLSSVLITGGLVKLAYEHQDSEMLSTWLKAQEAALAEAKPPEEPALSQELDAARSGLADMMACESKAYPGVDVDEAAKRKMTCREENLPKALTMLGKLSIRLLVPAAAPLWRAGQFMSVALADRQQLLRSPDLPQAERYSNSLKLAKSMPAGARNTFVLTSYLSGDQLAEARKFWQTAKPIQDKLDAQELKDWTALSGNIAEKVRQQQALLHGTLALKVMDYRGAEKQLHKLHAIYDGSPSWYTHTPDPTDAMALEIGVASGLGKHEEALRAADTAIGLLDDRRRNLGDRRLRGTLYSQTRVLTVFNIAIHAAMKAGDVSRVFDYIQRAKARSLQDHLLQSEQQAEGQDKLWLIERALNGLAPQLHGCVPTKDPVCAYRTAQRQELEQAFERELKEEMRRAPRPPALVKGRQANEVAQGLRPGTVLLDYYMGEHFLHIVILEHGRAPAQAVVRVANQVEVMGRADRLRRHMGLAHPEGDVQIQRDLRIFSQLLLEAPQVRQALLRPQVKELVLVPHAALHTVPFDLLPFSGQPLVSRFVLRYLPFAGTPRREPVSSTAQGAAILFSAGDSLVDTSRRQTLSRERQDVPRLRELYHEDAQTEMDAGRAQLLAALSTRRVVHVIAHGLVAAPGLTGVARSRYAQLDLKQEQCAAAQKAAPTSSQAAGPALGCDQGDLSVADLYAAPTDFHARLAYLDACLVAVGNGMVGDENVGIPRALLQKGVSGVIAPLWPIDDSAAQEFAVSFHAQYKLEGTAAAALATTQRRAIAAGTPAHVWAGYVAFGWE